MGPHERKAQGVVIMYENSRVRGYIMTVMRLSFNGAIAPLSEGRPILSRDENERL
jgi:hypothetical protein